jgi:hypothetical protein
VVAVSFAQHLRQPYNDLDSSVEFARAVEDGPVPVDDWDQGEVKSLFSPLLSSHISIEQLQPGRESAAPRVSDTRLPSISPAAPNTNWSEEEDRSSNYYASPIAVAAEDAFDLNVSRNSMGMQGTEEMDKRTFQLKALMREHMQEAHPLSFDTFTNTVRTKKALAAMLKSPLDGHYGSFSRPVTPHGPGKGLERT